MKKGLFILASLLVSGALFAHSHSDNHKMLALSNAFKNAQTVKAPSTTNDIEMVYGGEDLQPTLMENNSLA